MFATSLPSALGFPSPYSLDGYTRKWEPDPSRFIGITKIMPSKAAKGPIVGWDEFGPTLGMTPPHSGGGAPKTTKPPVRKRHEARTMYWAGTETLEQEDMDNIVAAGSLEDNGAEQHVMMMTNRQNLQLDCRMEWLAWKTIMGGYSIADDNGVVLSVSYTLAATPTAGTLWSTIASATPRSDIQAWIMLLRGKSTGMPSCYYNKQTAKLLSQNAQIMDLLKQSGNAELLSTDKIGQGLAILVGGVTEFVCYDEGYNDESGTFQPFIPDGKFVIIGNPADGDKIGYFRTTPTVRRGGLKPQAGRFLKVHNRLDDENPTYGQTCGINGVNTFSHPDCVIVATIA